MTYYGSVVAHALVYCVIFAAGIAVGMRHERNRRRLARRVGRT